MYLTPLCNQRARIRVGTRVKAAYGLSLDGEQMPRLFIYPTKYLVFCMLQYFSQLQFLLKEKIG